MKRMTATLRAFFRFRTLAAMVPLALVVTGSVCACAWGQGRVAVAAAPGANTSEILSLLRAALREQQPVAVVIVAGMNDAVNDRKFLSPTETAGNLQSMVELIRTHHAVPLLVTLHQPDLPRLMQRHTPAAYGNRQPAERIRDTNAVIQHIALQEHIALVPFGERLAALGGANEAWSTDGVHLTAQGYALLADSVYKTLAAAVQRKGLVLCVGDSLTYGIGVRAQGGPTNSEMYPAQLEALLQGTSHAGTR